MRKWVGFFIIVSGLLFAQSNKIIHFENGDVIHGLTKESDDGRSLRIKSDNFGVITVSKDKIKRIVESAKHDGGVAPSDDRAPTGRKMPDEDIITSRLLDFVPGSVTRAQISGVKTIAVKRVSVQGLFDLNDRVFEARLITLLARLGYTMVERQALAILLKEQELAASGAVADESKIGKLLGVDAFLVVELRTDRVGRVEASFKLTTVEAGTVEWEDDLYGEYYSPLRLSVSAVYGLPISDTLIYYDSYGQVTSATTGHMFGIGLNLGMQMPSWLSWLEIGLQLEVRSDLGFAPAPAPALAFDMAQQSMLVIALYPLCIKIHPFAWFNTPLDIVRIYGGVGTHSFSGQWKFGSGMNVGAGGESMSAMAGLEIAPIRDIALFAEVHYMMSERAMGQFVTQVVVPARTQFTFGLTYYFIK